MKTTTTQPSMDLPATKQVRAPEPSRERRKQLPVEAGFSAERISAATGF